MRALFLDDDEVRHNLLRENSIGNGYDTRHVKTVAQALKALSMVEFDFVSLDHDLGGNTFVDPSKEETGLDVARYISKMENPPPCVRVHSFNPEGAKEMVKVLKEGKSRTVYYQPFNGHLR